MSSPGYERGNGWDNGEKGDGDRLPMMPSWENARERRMDEGVELGRIENIHGVNAPDPGLGMGYHGAGAVGQRYTGAGAQTQAPVVGHGYTGAGAELQAPSPVNNGYGDWRNSTYAPSGSTRYEPTVYDTPQEMGRTYKAPEVAVGRKPVRDTWRDV